MGHYKIASVYNLDKTEIRNYLMRHYAIHFLARRPVI